MAEPALAPQPAAEPGSQPALRVLDGATGTPPQPAPARPEPRLEIPPYELCAALQLERELGVSHVLAQILVRRGFSEPPRAQEFLQAREEHPPDRFRAIEQAVDLIRRHIRLGSRITVHGDYDVDGVCATAVLVRALRALGADVDWSRTVTGCRPARSVASWPAAPDS